MRKILKMINIRSLFIGARLTLGPLYIATAILWLSLASPTWAQTQLELNEKAHAEFQASDLELNRVWQEILPDLTPLTKSKLTQSQLLWIKFRDAEAAAKASVYEGGSIWPLIYAQSRRATTQARTTELKLYLGDEEK